MSCPALGESSGTTEAARNCLKIFIALTDPGSLIPIKSRQGFPLRIHIANCDTTQLSLSQFFIFIVLQIMDGPFSVSAKYAA
jgi:hypothetical protein